MKNEPPKIMIASLPDTSLEALALRAFLEAAGRSAELRLIATPDQLYGVLEAPELAPDLLILCAHGCDGGLYFGQLVPELGQNLSPEGFLPPTALGGRVNLPGCAVLCTACDSGAAMLADAFISGGAVAYVGPKGQPEGSDMLLAAQHIVHAFVNQRCSMMSARQAAEQALGTAVQLAFHMAEPQSGPRP